MRNAVHMFSCCRFDGGSKVPIAKKSEFSEMKEGDVRAHPKYFEHKNYAIQFETGAVGIASDAFLGCM